MCYTAEVQVLRGHRFWQQNSNISKTAQRQRSRLKSHKNLITTGFTVTHIPTEFHRFLISSLHRHLQAYESH